MSAIGRKQTSRKLALRLSLQKFNALTATVRHAKQPRTKRSWNQGKQKNVHDEAWRRMHPRMHKE